jgi:hypothetical protein
MGDVAWTIIFIVMGGVLAGVVTVGSLGQRLLGLSIAAVLLAVQFVVKEMPLAWLMLIVTCIIALRVTDLSAEQRSRSAAFRVLHTFTPFDTRLVTWCKAYLDVPQLLEALAWGLLSYVSFKAAANSPVTSILKYYAIRWLFGLVWVVALFEATSRILRIITLIFGVKIPIPHDAPYRARSLREFWSGRWNKLVGKWLREHCYKPLARRGYPRLGLAASFAGSAALHLYITSVLLDSRWGLIMASLFLVQVPLLLAEDTLHIRQYSPLVGRTWTLGILILLSPLFTEPALRMFGLL